MLPLLLSLAAQATATAGARPTTAQLNAAAAARSASPSAALPPVRSTIPPIVSSQSGGAVSPAAGAPVAGAPLATPRAPIGPAKPTRAQVLAAVRAEFPRYDTSHQGRLGPLEFGTWVMRANGAAVQPAGRTDVPGVKPVTAMNATARAFAAADRDHDGGVTPDEMAAFLTRPQ